MNETSHVNYDESKNANFGNQTKGAKKIKTTCTAIDHGKLKMK